MNDDLYTQENSRTMPESNSPKSLVWEVIKFFIVAAIIVIPIRIFIAQPFLVDGPSMEPTFATGDYLIVDQLSYRLHEPARGDIAILRDPRHPALFLIKRIVGLPGETVSIDHGAVSISSDENPIGHVLDEPYIEYPKTDETMQKTLAGDEYFVMGDNRAESLDSRIIGPIKRSLIIGKAFLRLFPVAKASVLPGVHEVYN